MEKKQKKKKAFRAQLPAYLHSFRFDFDHLFSPFIT